jgi:hypothetical protein
MLRIEDTIFSFDLLEKKFICDLPRCLGSCCRYGDSGAPLSNEEVHILESILDDIKQYLRPEGLRAIEKSGPWVNDFENDKVTPLIENKECAYTTHDNNIYMCAIEKAWSEGKISFRKPLSCHLFPVRIKHYTEFRAVNYERIAICAPARSLGEKEGVYVYKFLKEPLIRALGEEMYNDLCIAADELRKNKTIR